MCPSVRACVRARMDAAAVSSPMVMVNVQGGRCWDTRAAVRLDWRGYGCLCLGEESWIQVENVGCRRTLAFGRASPLSYYSLLAPLIKSRGRLQLRGASLDSRTIRAAPQINSVLHVGSRSRPTIWRRCVADGADHRAPTSTTICCQKPPARAPPLPLSGDRARRARSSWPRGG